MARPLTMWDLFSPPPPLPPLVSSIILATMATTMLCAMTPTTAASTHAPFSTDQDDGEEQQSHKSKGSGHFAPKGVAPQPWAMGANAESTSSNTQEYGAPPPG